jgi:hypothetical protein
MRRRCLRAIAHRPCADLSASPPAVLRAAAASPATRQPAGPAGFTQ